MLAALTFVAAMATMGVAMDIPITREFNGGFQSEFCYTLHHFVHGWTAHIVFDHAVESLDVYSAEMVSSLHGNKEFVIRNKDYNSNFEAGEKLCLKFTAHTHTTPVPKAYFYIEGLDKPIDIHGNTHPIPTTTPDPQLANGSYVRVHSHRGAQFYAKPVDPRTSMTLSYDIFFSPGFDFVKGGKLPGLFGGATNCSGGRHSDLCFSARLMWRENGDGEVYGYIPEHQDSALCHQSDNVCNPTYGTSLGRGSWRFKVGTWQNIAVHVTLNTPGHLNGKLKVWHDGQPKLEMNNLNFRSSNDLKIEGLFFSTFFGGSDKSWAAGVDCYTYYKNFVLSAADNHPAIIG